MAGRAAAVLAAVAAAALRAPAQVLCSGGACGPNGVCSDGRCLCRSPFTGLRCERRAVVDSGHYYALLDARSPAERTPAPPRARPRDATPPVAERGAGVEIAAAGRGTSRSLQAGDRPGVLERWGERARPVVGEPPRGVVGSAPMQSLVGDVPVEYDDAVQTVSDFNEWTHFIMALPAFLVVVFVIMLICFLIQHSGEFGTRVFYLFAGDTRPRFNSMDSFVPGVGLLPSTVVRIERIILHDLEDAGGRDVFVEVDFGKNMIAATRVRSVQPVAAWSEPRVMQTLPEKDQPLSNRVVFTDKLEFNVRPFGEGDFVFRVKDQNVLGSELLGTLKLPAYDVVAKAKENESAPALNYRACLSNPIKPANGRVNRARILVWFVLGDSY